MSQRNRKSYLIINAIVLAEQQAFHYCKMNEITGDLLKLSTVHGLGAVKYKNLLDYFGSIRSVLKAGIEELKIVPGIGQKLAVQINSVDSRVDLEEEIKRLQKNEVSVLTILDEDYPANLKSIYDPPFILYVKGKIIPEDVYAVSVVGTRKATSYGKIAAEKISSELAKRNVTVISGLARGIDTVVHRSVVACKGRTIAVLGSGIDICYPPENRKLLEQVARNGAVISEFPLSTKPEKRNFPVRNRIISGLGLGTIIIEAPEKSGALITADMALEQGREVFAVPGSIFSENTRGTHSLIKQGAKLLDSYEDIIEEVDSLKKVMFLNIKDAVSGVTQKRLTVDEERIFDMLSFEPVQIDYISSKAEMPVREISIVLMGLEMKGRIKELTGKRYIRRA